MGLKITRRSITPDQLKKAETEFKQAKNRLTDLKAQAKNQERKEKRLRDSRRKILVGAWALSEMQKNGDFKTLALVGLERYLTRTIDRDLFPELESQKPERRT